ncbi:hypothetical protein S245_042128 [Arachis hypogaea]
MFSFIQFSVVSAKQKQKHSIIIVKALEASRPCLLQSKLINFKVLLQLNIIFSLCELMYVFNCVTEHESVVSVFESKLNRLHTTHSWDFLGLNSAYTGSHVALDWASDVIVGVVDSGIYFV